MKRIGSIVALGALLLAAACRSGAPHRVYPAAVRADVVDEYHGDAPPPGEALQARNAPPDVCFHRLGTDESADVVFARRPAQDGRNHSFSLSEDGATLFQSVLDVQSRKNELYRIPLVARDGGWSAAGEPEALVQGFDARSSVEEAADRLAFLARAVGLE